MTGQNPQGLDYCEARSRDTDAHGGEAVKQRRLGASVRHNTAAQDRVQYIDR
jgi:hypothetical protein